MHRPCSFASIIFIPLTKASTLVVERAPYTSVVVENCLTRVIKKNVTNQEYEDERILIRSTAIIYEHIMLHSQTYEEMIIMILILKLF